MAYQGFFKPLNPKKYKGDPNNIIYRSSWELKFCSYCDSNPNIIEWESEEIGIRYISPKDMKPHTYFPDFLITVKKGDLIEKYLIEIKPEKQQKPPAPLKPGKKPTRSYINEVFTWGINEAKWKAAKRLCDEKGWKFMILGEKQLNIKF